MPSARKNPTPKGLDLVTPGRGYFALIPKGKVELSLIVVKTISVELGVLLLLDILHICGSFLNPSPLCQLRTLLTRNDCPNRAFVLEAETYSELVSLCEL